MLVHPDKNPTMTDRASLAFEGKSFFIFPIQSSNIFFFLIAINKAYKLLEDERERKKCIEVVEEARERVEKMVSQSHVPSVRCFPKQIGFDLYFLPNRNKKQTVRNL